jgi:hypothetical protein
MHTQHQDDLRVNLTDTQRRAIQNLRAAGWAVCVLSPSFTGGGTGVQREVESAMARAGYESVYEYHVGVER